MKKVLKISSLIVIFTIILVITGCNRETANVSGSLNEIITKLYQDIEEDKMPVVENQEITADNMEHYLGSSDIEYKEGLASEPIIGSIAHSIILLRARDGQNIEDLKTKLKESINPRKWICVWVEDEDVIIKNKGDLVIAIVVENKDIRETVSKNFDAL